MPYDRWFNNPLVVLTAFDGINKIGTNEGKFYAHKPCFQWTNVPLMIDYVPSYAYVSCLKKIGDYYIAAIRGTSGTSRILYCSTNIASGWQQVCLETCSLDSARGPIKVAGGPGWFVAVGLHPGKSYPAATCDYNVSYASSPSGSWNASKIYYKGILEDFKNDISGYETEVREVEGMLLNDPMTVAYGAGLYVISARQANNLRMLTASSPDAACWEQTSYLATDRNTLVWLSDMIYVNGEFVACGHVQTEIITGHDIRGSFRPFIAHAADPTERWQSGMIDDSSCSLSRLCYANGLFAAIGEDKDENMYVYYAPSASGPWSRRFIAGPTTIGDLVYADGKWLISHSGFGKFENPINGQVGNGNVPMEIIAITDDLATGRILEYCYNRDYNDPFIDTPGDLDKWRISTFSNRMCYDNGKLALLGEGRNLIVSDFPFENFDMVYP